MRVSFWFDPACPFCWLTSRWVNDIAPHRQLDIDWQPISLLFKNDPPESSPSFASLTRTRDLLRVVEAVRSRGEGDRIGDLYTEFGRRIHHDETADFAVEPILKQLGLDPSSAGALDDPTFDQPIRAAMGEGLALTGTDVGTPLIAFEVEGRRVGLFGPVIATFPPPDQGLRLWDGFVAVASVDGFYELKRTRDRGPAKPPPDKI